MNVPVFEPRRLTEVGTDVRQKALWKCPRCGRKFANVNQWHSCGFFSVKQHFKGKSPEVVAVYRRFASAVRACGPARVTPVKTRIGFQTRMIFACVFLKKHWMDAQVVLARRLEHARFRKIESLSPRNHVHEFRIHSTEEIDDVVKSWIAEAYKVGNQEHLRE